MYSVAVEREPFCLDSYINSANCSFTDSSERDIVTDVYNKYIFKEYVLMLDEYNYDERLKSWKLLK